MKKKILIAFAIIIVATASSITKGENRVERVSDKLKFSEGTLINGNDLLISNFGTDDLNPLNSEGKGYIVRFNNGKTEILIKPDGSLNAPKGMAIKGDFLYIADVGKVVVYNLKRLKDAPQIIAMPEGNLFVNDIVIDKNMAYISVTNTGKLFTLDISNPTALTPKQLAEYADVTGANGLLLNGNTLYIASYPADGVTTKDNVIYKIADISAPKTEKLINRSGQYDGLALQGSKLYFSSWVNGEVGFIDLKTKAVTLLDLGKLKLVGPADISISGNTLYIPHLPTSEIIAVKL